MNLRNRNRNKRLIATAGMEEKKVLDWPIR
jgi:hypothetical protein